VENKICRARAPLRLGLAGGGTDISPFCDVHHGAVLNATISMYAYATIQPYKKGRVRFEAADLGIAKDFKSQAKMEIDDDLKLHSGVYNRIVTEFNDGKPMDVWITTSNDAPPGSGLGSSSTVVVAMVQAFADYLRLPLGEYDIAKLAYQIEREDLGLSGGKQDQYAATFGGVNFIEFNGEVDVIVNPLRIRNSILAEFEASLVLYYTGVSRESAAIIVDQTKVLKNNDQAALMAMHELKKDSFKMKEALLKGNIVEVGEILHQSWQSKKKTSSKVSNPFIDEIYDAVMKVGVIGGKISGAGGGGFAMFIVDPKLKPRVIAELSKFDGKIFPCHFVNEGSFSWRVNSNGE
jgi:D-glycero-alpha-D-manno-heptose-7-phosphate kinase